jgi:SAM-dependent methyltransferase
MLALARRRLGARASFQTDSFLRASLPQSDATVASFALHHVRTRAAKAALYRRIRAALRPGGVLVTVDCQPARDALVRRAQFAEWLAHLRRTYAPAEARGFLRAWSHEDVYQSLDGEMALMQSAGFGVELLWRRGAFAVIRATRSFRTKIAG